jgi:hypothetical protein
MNWMPSKVGAEKKKLALVVGLLLVAGYFYFSNRDSSGPGAAAPSNTAASSPVPAAQRMAARSGGRLRSDDSASNSAPREFRPSIPKSVDPSGVDPTLHLNELAQLRQVPLEGGTRSLFEISAAPPAEIAALKEPAHIQPKEVFVGPKQPPRPDRRRIPKPRPSRSNFTGSSTRPRAAPINAPFSWMAKILSSPTKAR